MTAHGAFGNLADGRSATNKATSGYLMIQRFGARSFRCFDRIELQGLTRVNVVTGTNASGKTALLEAIYLAGNATATALQNINSARGLMQTNTLGILGGLIPLALAAVPSKPEAVFDHLFRTVHTNDGVEIAPEFVLEYTDSESINYNITCSYQGAGETQPPAPIIPGPGGLSPAVPLVLNRVKQYSNGRMDNSRIQVSINQFGQLAVQPTGMQEFGPTTFIFGPTTNYAELDNVAWFSQLKEKNQAEMVTHFVQEEFPFIRGIEVLAPAGINGLYAILGDGTRRRITMVSSGIYKVISILLASASARKGIIVIDEIENGVFYEKYRSVWRVLYKFAEQTQNQIFVSSHSAECLRELAPEVEGKEKEFSLLRVERSNGACEVRQISGASMKAALKRGGDIRGTTLGPQVHH